MKRITTIIAAGLLRHVPSAIARSRRVQDSNSCSRISKHRSWPPVQRSMNASAH
jgi:hypothetical protein